MAVLKTQTNSSLNISSEVEVLTYTYSSSQPIEVVVRVDLGSTGQPIAGNSIYTLNFYINNTLITPASNVNVPSGVTKTILVSRSVPIISGDVVTIKVLGDVSDISVATSTTLRDVTPIIISDITGGGTVLVNHNYGGTDNLSYKTSVGVGVDNAEVKCFLKSDYDAGNISNAFVVARTTTKVGGIWATYLELDPSDYTLVYSKQGYYGPDIKEITVT